jgi:hypothetical protein
MNRFNDCLFDFARTLKSHGRLILMALIAVSLSPLYTYSANAGTYCSGVPEQVLTYDHGRVMIFGSWRNDWTSICSVEEEWKGVGIQTCWNWFALVNEAASQGNEIIVYYSDLSSNADCATLPIYGASIAPGYVRRVVVP